MYRLTHCLAGIKERYSPRGGVCGERQAQFRVYIGGRHTHSAVHTDLGVRLVSATEGSQHHANCE